MTGPEPDQERLAKAEIFIDSIKLPAQANVIMEINKEVSGKDPDIQKITNLVRRDIAISAAVIKTVNSPLFGLRAEVTSITQALTLLGLNNFHKVVLASQLKEVLSGGWGDDSGDFKKFWDHFLAVAKAAELVAQTFMKLKFFDLADQAFMAGLFHDCGIPLLIEKYPGYVTEAFGACDGVPEKLFALETERYGFDHASLSYALARSWGVQEGTCLAIRHHHQKDAVIDNDYGAKLWIILRLADYLAEYVASQKGENLQEFKEFGPEMDKTILPAAVMAKYDLYEEDLLDLKEFALSELPRFLKEGPAREEDGDRNGSAEVKKPPPKKKKKGWFG